MKVYVIFEKDGYDGECIAGIYRYKEQAKKEKELKRCFDRIEEHEIIEWGVSRVVEITGLKQPYISSWMHGHRNMSLEKMVDIYNKLRVEKWQTVKTLNGLYTGTYRKKTHR